MKKCERCGSDLYTYGHTPAGDHPELEVWYIECVKCETEIGGCWVSEKQALEWINDRQKIL